MSITKETTLTTSKSDKMSGRIQTELLVGTRKGITVAHLSRTLGELSKIAPKIVEPYLVEYELPETMTLFEAQNFVKTYLVATTKDARAAMSAIDSNFDNIFGKVSEAMVQEAPTGVKVADVYDLLDDLPPSEITKYLEERSALEKKAQTKQLGEQSSAV